MSDLFKHKIIAGIPIHVESKDGVVLPFGFPNHVFLIPTCHPGFSTMSHHRFQVALWGFFLFLFFEEEELNLV